MPKTWNHRLTSRVFFLLALLSYLFNLALSQPREVWKAQHGAAIQAVQYSPDGKLLASSGGPTVRVRDAATGRECFRLEHPVKAWRTRFSPKNDRILTVAIDPPADGISETRLWSGDGKPLAILNHGINEAIFAEFEPSGQRIMTLAVEWKDKGKHELRFWDLQGRPLGTPLVGNELVLTPPLFSPDGRFVAYKAMSDGLTVVDTRTGKQLKVFPPHPSFNYAAAFSPDSRQLAVGLPEGGVSLMDTAGWNSQRTLEAERYAGALAFSPQGLLAVESWSKSDHTFRMWNPATGLPATDSVGLSASAGSPIRQLSFNADGGMVFALNWHYTDDREPNQQLVSVLDTRAGRLLCERPVRLGGNYANATWHPNQKWLLTGAKEGLMVWQASDGQTVSQIPTPEGFNCYNFRPGTNHLAVGTSKGDLTVWDVPDQRH